MEIDTVKKLRYRMYCSWESSISATPRGPRQALGDSQHQNFRALAQISTMPHFQHCLYSLESSTFITASKFKAQLVRREMLWNKDGTIYLLFEFINLYIHQCQSARKHFAQTIHNPGLLLRQALGGRLGLTPSSRQAWLNSVSASHLLNVSP